ncbi:MAG: transcription termination factor Rho [Verrucomicrobiaceae bacterium]|nr:transcription termination factor Rho [Verrucomicrobiaceae bacterium]
MRKSPDSAQIELPFSTMSDSPKVSHATGDVAEKKPSRKRATPVAEAPVAKPAAKKATAKKAAKKATTKKAKAAPAAAAPPPPPPPAPVVAEKTVAKKKAARKTATKSESAPAPSPTPVASPAPAPVVVAAPQQIQAAQPPAPAPAPAPAATADATSSDASPPPSQEGRPQHRNDRHPNDRGQQDQGRNQSNDRQGGDRQPQGEGNDQERGGRRFRDRGRKRRWGKDRDRDRRQGGGGGGENRDPNNQAGDNGAPTQNADNQRETPPEKPQGPPEPAEGILEMSPKGYGFLRQRNRQFAQHPMDAFIGPEFIRQYGLREGMMIKGEQRKGSRGPQVTEVAEVNGRAPESMRELPLFEELKAINPNKRIQFETTKERLTTRVIDMITPVGRGQRGLIVAPPRAGKTTLLQHIAESIVTNHPGMHLMVMLVDERPEEVTEFKRVLPTAEIFASSNDMDVKSHNRIAQFAIERAKRLVECGEHVFILLDSITRLARSFNNASKGGATMSGGMGVGAMEIPRRLFAAARNTRGAGSLTILATALIETGSRMDDLIFQEFKGTGNMELVLDRKIAEQFYYPAVNIFKSGTRREELLLPVFQLDKIHMLRRGLAGHKPLEAIQRVLSLLERYPSNAQMLVDLPSKS